MNPKELCSFSCAIMEKLDKSMIEPETARAQLILVKQMTSVLILLKNLDRKQRWTKKK